MTLAELKALQERAALAQPAKTTGFRLVTDMEACDRLANGAPSGLVDGRTPRTRFGVAWIVDGSFTAGVIAWFDRQADAHRLYEHLTGERPTPRPAQADPAPILEGNLALAPDPEQPEAPELAPVASTHPAVAASVPPRSDDDGVPDPVVGARPGIRLCAGCDEPLPADARPNRTAHNAACRERARYRRAAELSRADANGRTPDLTVSSPPATGSPDEVSNQPHAALREGGDQLGLPLGS